MSQSCQNIKLVVAYDGTDYLGWQKNNEGASVEGVLNSVLEKIFQHPIILQAASRTDAGVHAHQQVVNFFTAKTVDFSSVQMSINRLLPKSMIVTDIQMMPESFHPTLDCIGKEYHYYLCFGKFQEPVNRFYSWHYPAKLNIDQMREAALSMVGEHDFSAFCNYVKQLHYKDTVRRIDAINVMELDNQRLCIKVVGNHFLYKMVRNIVGTLVYVGNKKINSDQILRILSEKDRTQVGITAPSKGLFLHRVLYNSEFMS
jgi:tRNA pseudouridine38-40 synthase